MIFRTILAATFSVLLVTAANAATLITSHNPTPAELMVLGGTSLDLPGGASWLDAPAYGFTVPDQVAAVSYTHLDVYKRQPFQPFFLH